MKITHRMGLRDEALQTGPAKKAKAWDSMLRWLWGATLEVNMMGIHVAVEDFERARRQARRRDWFSFLTRKKNDLLSFDDIRPELRSGYQRSQGLQTIPLDKIVGSEGRPHEFDRAFYPREKRTRDRWVSIDRAHYANRLLPPIELLKVGDLYFVRDGNHRVSVARSRGQAFIDAKVIEIVGSEAK